MILNDPFADESDLQLSDDEYNDHYRGPSTNPEEDELPTLIQDYDFGIQSEEMANHNKISVGDKVVADSIDIRSSTVNHLNTGLALASKNKINKKRFDVRKGITFEKNNSR